MLDSGVLVLNRVYRPVHITSVRRAFTLLYQGAARAIDEQFQLFDFDSWAALAAAEHHDAIGTVDRRIRIPRVIVLLAYEHMPKSRVRFSRFNIYARDDNTCQYCGVRFAKSELNIDHVIPRARGGTSVWENVVCSCLACNRRKGGRSPQEAGLALIRTPRKPHWATSLNISLRTRRYKEWLPFLNIVDASYWNVELER